MKRIGTLLGLLLMIIVAAGCAGEKPADAIPTYTVESPSATVESVEALTGTAEPESTRVIPTPVYLMNKTPEPGTISARGMLIVMNPFSAIPDADDAIYLVPLASVDQNISAIPPIGTEGTIQAEVDEGTGEFLFNGIEPGQYVVLVREKTGVELPPRIIGSESMAIFTFSETDRDQTVDLGWLQFP
jgi:hypothetical protein